MSCPDNPTLKSIQLKLALQTDSSNSSSTCTDAFDEKKIFADTLLIARSASHPQRGTACGDVGTAYAAGAFGAELDKGKAEVYLKLGVGLGDVAR